MEFILFFALDIVIASSCMYLATKFAFVEAEFRQLLVIVFITSVIGLVPTIGWIASFAVFAFLLMRITHSDLMDCIWVVAFTKLITLVLVLVIGSVLV